MKRRPPRSTRAYTLFPDTSLCRSRTTDLAEIGAAVLVRAQIARPARHILAGQLAQPIDIGGEALEIGIERGIGAVGGGDAATPAAVADRGDGRAGRSALRWLPAPRC